VTSPSTVTQEVELVYWKDIKDSTEAEEFEAFLEKFPAGIYADLARRRLRKLTGGGNSSPDQTVLSGATFSDAAPTSEPDEEATRLRTGTMPSIVKPAETTSPSTMPVAAPTQAPAIAASAPTVAPAPVKAVAAPALATADGDSSPTSTGTDFPATVTFIRPTDAPKPEAKADPAPVAAPVTAAAPKSAPPARKAPAAAGAKKPPIAVLAGIGAVVVLGIAAFAMMGRSKAPDPAAAAASSAASAAVVAAEPASAAASTGEAAASAAVLAVAAAASEPVHTASAAASTTHPASKAAVAAKPKAPPAKGKASNAPAPVETARPQFIPAPAQEAKPASSPPPANNANAAEACRDKVFLSREFCLAEACEKPGARNHPLCVKWREEKRLREGMRGGSVGG
jgi:serine/threonine-protein kinase